MADKRAEEFKAVADFLADRNMREARNPVPRGYSPFAPSHKASERKSHRRARRD